MKKMKKMKTHMQIEKHVRECERKNEEEKRERDGKKQ